MNQNISKSADRKIRFCEHTIEQLVVLYTHMEGVRWKFVAAFGVLTVGGIVGLTQATSDSIRILSSLFSIVTSIAALICLGRVYSVTVTLWNKISACQSEILVILDSAENAAPVSEPLRKLLLFRFENARSWQTYWMTVTHASSLIFSGVSGGMTVYLYSILMTGSITWIRAVLMGCAVFLVADYLHYRLSKLSLADICEARYASRTEDKT